MHRPASLHTVFFTLTARLDAGDESSLSIGTSSCKPKARRCLSRGRKRHRFSDAGLLAWRGPQQLRTQNLWSHNVTSSYAALGIGVLNNTCNSKINQLDFRCNSHIFGAHENVIHLEISMQNPTTVHELEARQNLSKCVASNVLLKPATLCYNFSKATAFYQFYNHHLVHGRCGRFAIGVTFIPTSNAPSDVRMALDTHNAFHLLFKHSDPAARFWIILQTPNWYCLHSKMLGRITQAIATVD
mmetsp:Transcript_76951/g.152379  ORF Transcript_76951/g.152379 Transcript_76951/m.152379 type:complete len:243 (+) Transcript_76951:582-1310(+)